MEKRTRIGKSNAAIVGKNPKNLRGLGIGRGF